MVHFLSSLRGAHNIFFSVLLAGTTAYCLLLLLSVHSRALF